DHLRVPLPGNLAQIPHHQPLQSGMQAIFDLVDGNDDSRATPASQFAKQKEDLLFTGRKLVKVNSGGFAVVPPTGGDSHAALFDRNPAVFAKNIFYKFNKGLYVVAISCTLFQI